ncbi:MAG TPA: DUF4136 domain-containing protein, partial [Steroidobacteraceae bacterium]|nr:DUF4136 domain-containing protein [Steroidobacteraceae bacterium]
MRILNSANVSLDTRGGYFRRWVGIAVASLLLAGCASLRTGADYDRAADFSGFHRFAWMPREHHDSSNPIVVRRAHEAIEAELARRGFVDAGDPTAADFIVDFTIGSRERVDVASYPAPYGMSYRNYPDWWGHRYWGGAVDVREYREGTLSIDVFDAHTDRPVWHGWASKELTSSDLKHSQRPIRAAVEAVLRRFPPRPDGS